MNIVERIRVYVFGCLDFLVNVLLCFKEKIECFNVGNGIFCVVCFVEKNVVFKILFFEFFVLYLYSFDFLKG